MTRQEHVLALAAQGLTAEEICRKTGYGRNSVSTTLWKAKHPDQVRAAQREFRQRDTQERIATREKWARIAQEAVREA